MDNTIPESVVNAACEAAWPEFRSHLEGQQAWIDADPLRQNRLRLIVIQALTAAQQQNGGEAGAFDANFLRHIASVCRATYDLCQSKPQRTPEDVREHYGELCLLELTSIADEIERRLTASSGKAGEVAGWVRGDTFVDAKFWTADTPPQGWTPVYLTASQTAAVAAIQFALSNPEGMTFLRMWNEGEFDILRREWPEAPSEVYVGADPLAAAQKQGQLNVGAPRTPEQIAATVAWVQSLADSGTASQPAQQDSGEAWNRERIEAVASRVERAGDKEAADLIRDLLEAGIEAEKERIDIAPPSALAWVEKVKKALERLDLTIEACAKLTRLLGDGQPHSDLISTAGGQAALAKEAIQRALAQQQGGE